MGRGSSRARRGVAATATATAIAVCAAAGALGAPGAQGAGSGDTILASGTANADSYTVAVSDGGRRVLFRSRASNLDPAVDGTDSELFVFDRPSGRIRLASRATGPAGAQAGDVYSGDLTADGRLVVFTADFDGGTTHVFVRDLEKDITTLVDRTTAGDVANGNAYGARLSADGRSVAFISTAANLGGDGSTQQVYVRDLRTGGTTLASRADGPNGALAPEVDGSDYMALSADGRHVAFVHVGPGLTADALPPSSSQLYVRDLDTDRTELVSRATGPGGAANTSYINNDVALSADGRYVAFPAWGSAVLPGVGAGIVHIYVRDRVANTTTLVDRADGVAGAFSGTGLSASMSADGRQVAFDGYGPGMVPDAATSGWGVYVRDLATGTTRLAGRGPGPGGPSPNADARSATLSPDGRAVAFVTTATNLLPGVGGNRQIYVRTLTGDAPEPLVQPSITGLRRLGETLRCAPGTWANDAPAFAYAWLRDGAPVAGATSDTYILSTPDLDLPLTCRVTATNAGGAATADSAPTTVPAPARDGAPGAPGPAGPAGPPAAPPAVAAQTRLVVALADARRTVARGRTLTLRYATTDATGLTLTATPTSAPAAKRKATRLATATAKRAGRGTIGVKVKLAPGTYRLTLTAMADGRSATDTLRLTVKR